MFGIDICVQTDDTGDIYLTTTGMGGGMAGMGVGVGISAPSSNAPTVQNLGGFSGTFGGSAGQLVVAGIDVTLGQYAPGKSYSQSAPRIGLGGEAPLPGEIHGGGSITLPFNVSDWLGGGASSYRTWYWGSSGKK